MQYIFRSLCLMAGLLVAALPAQAIDFKPYAGAGAGVFIIDAGVGAENAFGGYAILGTDLHENYGIEFRFGTTGKTGTAVVVPQGFPNTVVSTVAVPANISIDWFVSYLLKLQYPVNEAFRIYGLVGGTTLRSKFAFTAPIFPLTFIETTHSTKTAFSFGGGLDYDLGNQWIVGIDAMVYANDANTNPGANFTGLDVWGLTATAKYMF